MTHIPLNCQQTDCAYHDLGSPSYCRLTGTECKKTLAVKPVSGLVLAEEAPPASPRPAPGQPPASPLQTQEGGSHYKDMVIQPLEFIVKNGIPYMPANVIKYACRYKNKNGAEDLKKARHYINLILEMEYGIRD